MDKLRALPVTQKEIDSWTEEAVREHADYMDTALHAADNILKMLRAGGSVDWACLVEIVVMDCLENTLAAYRADFPQRVVELKKLIVANSYVIDQLITVMTSPAFVARHMSDGMWNSTLKDSLINVLIAAVEGIEE